MSAIFAFINLEFTLNGLYGIIKKLAILRVL